MNRIPSLLTWAMLAAGATLSPVVAADDAAKTKPVRIALVGDSTVASYPKPPADRPDLAGWGQVFGECFTDQVSIINHAASGRSSKSFLAEGRWEPVLDAKLYSTEDSPSGSGPGGPRVRRC
jgi:lysophospholipase L1-like esterase